MYNKEVEDSINYADNKNVIVVAAAGDYSERDLLFPASMSRVIAVASEDEKGNICGFSSYSENKSPLFFIPGEDIETLSIDEEGKTIIERSEGTSVSCALMAGIIALGLEIRPDACADLLTNSLYRADQGRIIDVREFLKILASESEPND